MNFVDLKNFISAKIAAESPKELTYHGLHHTLYVLQICEDYVERLQLEDADALALKTAALFHDIGILWDYKNHEEESVLYVKTLLPTWNYTEAQIEQICNIIMATKLPQGPQNLLEEILCDADLDYLGTDLFYTVGNTLFKEFLFLGVIKNEAEWNTLQINFLQKHAYHTKFAQTNREPVKQLYIAEIKKQLGLN